MGWPLGDLATAAETFGRVAATDPVSAVLVAVGALIVGATVIVTGTLAAAGLSNRLLGWP